MGIRGERQEPDPRARVGTRSGSKDRNDFRGRTQDRIGGNSVVNTMTTKENLRRHRKCSADFTIEIRPG